MVPYPLRRAGFWQFFFFILCRSIIILFVIGFSLVIWSSLLTVEMIRPCTIELFCFKGQSRPSMTYVFNYLYWRRIIHWCDQFTLSSSSFCCCRYSCLVLLNRIQFDCVCLISIFMIVYYNLVTLNRRQGNNTTYRDL